MAHEIALAEFARAVPMRAPKVALFLGAGASVSSGVPSAAHLVWEFKRSIYVSETGIRPERLGPLADAQVRRVLQRHFDAQAGYPREGAPDEYAAYFARAYPDPDDRRLFMSRRLGEPRPQHGYLCLGALLQAEKVHYVWTPNFEDLVTTAYSIVTDGHALPVVGRDSGARLEVLRRDRRVPVLVKLHGDFRYDALQNTEAELQALDAELRAQFVELARDYGIAVVGYSGRDRSIMNAFEEALARHGAQAFPAGLYWGVRGEEPVPDAVGALLERAAAGGTRAAVVRIGDFDDFAAALYQGCQLSHPRVERSLDEARRTRTGYVLQRQGKHEPVLKLNAVPVVGYPESCHRFRARVDSWADLRALVNGRPLVAALYKGAVLALGPRAEVEAAFAARALTDLQPMPLGPNELRRLDSVFLGLLYEAIVLALTGPGSALAAGPKGRQSRLLYVRRDHGLPETLVKEFAQISARQGAALVRAPRERGVPYWAHEAAELRLDFREDRLWLLVQPTVFLSADGAGTPWEDPRRGEIINEVLATRYNRQASDLLTFWLHLTMHTSDQGVLRFPPGHEVGFHFHLAERLGFAYHAGALITEASVPGMPDGRAARAGAAR